MALCQFVMVTLLALQGSSLDDLEKRTNALAKTSTWSPEINAQRVRINSDLLKLVDADVLRSGEDFRRAASMVQFERGALPETRLRYELTVVAMTLGDERAAALVKPSWDQFLISTGRRQHLGSSKSFQGMQAEKFEVDPAPECVQTVLDNPAQAKEEASKLTRNTEIKSLVEEDQKVRQGDWSKLTQAQMLEISKADDARRTRLKALLKGIRLMTAEDYSSAALVMQHGSWFDDYALAHELALCATILDPKVGRQMIAVSYDRMLESAGYRQRIGTQYHGVTLAEVDSAGFNDTMRKAFGRLPLAQVPKKIGG